MRRPTEENPMIPKLCIRGAALAAAMLAMAAPAALAAAPNRVASVEVDGPRVVVHGIAGVSVAQFDEGESRVGRVVVALEGDAKYEAVARGNDLVVTIEKAAPAA